MSLGQSQVWWIIIIIIIIIIHQGATSSPEPFSNMKGKSPGNEVGLAGVR